MPTNHVKSGDSRSGARSFHNPILAAARDFERLVVLRKGITSRTRWESVAESILRSSEGWIVSNSVKLQRPTLLLDLGIRHDSNLLSGHRLQLYANVIADRIKALSGVQFSSVRLSKHHGDSTSVAVAESMQWERPPASREVVTTTRRSYAAPAFGEEVYEATRGFDEILVPGIPLGLYVSYVTGFPRTWSRLWGPTLSGVLARPSHDRDIDSAQIVDLGFDHLSVGEELGHRVQMAIAAWQATTEG